MPQFFWCRGGAMLGFRLAGQSSAAVARPSPFGGGGAM